MKETLKLKKQLAELQKEEKSYKNFVVKHVNKVDKSKEVGMRMKQEYKEEC